MKRAISTASIATLLVVLGVLVDVNLCFDLDISAVPKWILSMDEGGHLLNFDAKTGKVLGSNSLAVPKSSSCRAFNAGPLSTADVVQLGSTGTKFAVLQNGYLGTYPGQIWTVNVVGGNISVLSCAPITASFNKGVWGLSVDRNGKLIAAASSSKIFTGTKNAISVGSLASSGTFTPLYQNASYFVVPILCGVDPSSGNIVLLTQYSCSDDPTCKKTNFSQMFTTFSPAGKIIKQYVLPRSWDNTTSRQGAYFANGRLYSFATLLNSVPVIVSQALAPPWNVRVDAKLDISKLSWYLAQGSNVDVKANLVSVAFITKSSGGHALASFDMKGKLLYQVPYPQSLNSFDAIGMGYGY